MARWWPLLGLAAMVLLGVVVGSGTTPIDSWFQHVGDRMGSLARDLLWFTYPPVGAAVLVVLIAVVARRRQWPLVAVVALTPLVAIAVVRLIKPLFGREKEGALAYPSGHTTFLVVVLALLVVVTGITWWSVTVAVCWALFGMLGQALTYHYFTDTVGGVLLAVSLVGITARVGGRRLRLRPASRLRLAMDQSRSATGLEITAPD